MTIEGRKKTILWLAFSIPFLSLAGLSLLVIKFHRYDQRFPPEHLIGNRPSNVKALEEKGLPFSFLVIGDIHNSRRGTTLIERASKADHASSMIILGDFVTKPDIWYHRYFLTEMTTGTKPPFPVFFVPGNHDIDYSSSKIGKQERRVTPEVYESLYGPRNFRFTFNNCLFVICGIDPGNQSSYLTCLRDVLSEEGRGKRCIFLFMHHPPKGVGIAGSFSFPL